MEPHQHRVNAAERAIQTFKNHFIAGLCTVDPNFPLQLWCDLLPQAQLTLNILRQSRINPRLSAHAQLEGTYDFNKVPLVPPGTKAMIFQPPKVRKTWAPHAKEGWYVGPAFKHYRCYKFWIPDTKGYTIAQTAKFFPKYSTIPTVTPEQYAVLVARDLIKALMKVKTSKTFKLKDEHKLALLKLAKLFNIALPIHNQDRTLDEFMHGPPRVETESEGRQHTDTKAQPPRVGIVTPPTPSSNPTQDSTLRTQPRIHNRVTRANTPIPTQENIPHRYTTRSTKRAPRIISQSATTPSINNTFEYLPHKAPVHTGKNIFRPTILHTCNGVTHPVTGHIITKYRALIKDPLMKDIWEEAFCVELGRLAQGYKQTKGTNTIRFMTRKMVLLVPKGRTITYARIVVDYRPQKADPNRVRMTAGGNLIDYPDELTTRTADLCTTKLMWNSVLSTKNARYFCIDIKNMYLATPLDRFEYMKIPVGLVPTAIMILYKLYDHVIDGFIYIQIEKGMYGLPQAGILANKLLHKNLEPHGYYEAVHTPGLWLHKHLPIKFTLVVDDFGVEYVGMDSAQHLINALRKNYEISIDWEGSLYCGISLKWNYEEGYVDASMPKYVEKTLRKFDHQKPTRPQHTPMVPAPRVYGKEAQ